MNNASLDLKETVLAYVGSADDKLLQMMKTLAEDYELNVESKVDEKDSHVPEWHYKELDKEREKYIHTKEESASPWEEVKTRLEKRYEV